MMHEGLPLYYPDKSLADMETMLRKAYLARSGWLESAETKMALRGGKPVPWFTYPAIAFLERIIGPDLSLFEYSGGQSTLYWAERLAQVVAVDYNPAFVAHLKPLLPANAHLMSVGEGARPDPGLVARGVKSPDMVDPPRDDRTLGSGQLNTAFRNYALQLLAWPDAHFDMVVINGMARVLSSWAAIQHFPKDGLIIFDNSDREEYRAAYDMFDAAGFRRIDFWGLGAVNPYEWCTSVFYRSSGGNGTRWFSARTSALPTPGSATDPDVTRPPTGGLGILVLGYNRALHLQAVLESLRLQGRIGDVHVWIDGTQGRGEYLDANRKSVEIARRYAVREVRAQRSHLGIEKLMLDALDAMSQTYDRVLVLEDDCFPLDGAVAAFEATLAETLDDPCVYSVYGHHFGVEPSETPDFPRFQGWGWAAHSDRIRAFLPELQRLFLLSEADYLDGIRRDLTDPIRARLNVTPQRNVLGVLEQFFSWDSATSFLAAARGMVHRRTPMPTVRNTGIVPGIGHFRDDQPRYRAPPFNMITLDEAWDHWDRTTTPCLGERKSYGLEALDLEIRAALPEGETGTFVEIGAFDGVTQSNSVLLEQAGWRGLLIEPAPEAYARCRRARPLAHVANAACVATGFADDTTTITDVGLMSMSGQSLLEDVAREDWIARGEGFAGRPAQQIDVPAIPMSTLLDRYGIDRVDLLLLDVEGAEIEVLSGLDFGRHAPTRIVAEDAYDDTIQAYLAERGYVGAKILLERKFTRDCLYLREDRP